MRGSEGGCESEGRVCQSVRRVCAGRSDGHNGGCKVIRFVTWGSREYQNALMVPTVGANTEWPPDVCQPMSCVVWCHSVSLTVCRLRKQLTGEEGEMGGKPKDPEAAGQDDKGRRLVGLESSAVGTYAECYPGYVPG